MKTPSDKQIALTLYSHPMKDLALRWKATVVFAPGSDDDSSAAVKMVDGRGEPIASGVFAFAGARIRIVRGAGSLRCGDFVAGKHETAIWLHREGCEPVPGALTFE